MSAPGINYPYMGFGNALPFCVRPGDPDTSTFPPLYDGDSGHWDHIPWPGSSQENMWHNFHWWIWKFKGANLSTLRIEYESNDLPPYDGPFEITPQLPAGYENFYLTLEAGANLDDPLWGPSNQRPCMFEQYGNGIAATHAYPVMVLDLMWGEYTPDLTSGIKLFLSVAKYMDGPESRPCLLYRLGDEDGGKLTISNLANLRDPSTGQGSAVGVEVQLGPELGQTGGMVFSGCEADGIMWEVTAATIEFQFWA